MVLILLSFLSNPDNMLLELHLQLNWLFLDRFKVVRVPGMINKEVLTQFKYNSA